MCTRVMDSTFGRSISDDRDEVANWEQKFLISLQIPVVYSDYGDNRISVSKGNNPDNVLSKRTSPSEIDGY